MKKLPEPIERHEQLWLEMLSDGELKEADRQRLFAYLDRADGNPSEGAWKRLAKTLLHERELARQLHREFGADDARETAVVDPFALEQAAPGSPVAKARPVSGSHNTDKPSLAHVAHGSSSGSSLGLQVLAACAAFVLGALAVLGGQKLTGWEQVAPSGIPMAHAGNEDKSVGEQESKLSLTSNMDALRRARLRLESGAHTIYEIENTPTSATYYLSQAMPELLLQSLVLAGHQVEVNQEYIDVPTEHGKTMSVPVSMLHVKKFANAMF